MTHFVNGGAKTDRVIYRWSSGTPVQDTSLDTNNLYAIANNSTVAMPTALQYPGWSFANKNGTAGTYLANTFVEGFVDLDSIASAFNVSALDLCFASFLIETKNSQSLTASLEDFTLGVFGTIPRTPILSGGTFCASVTNGGTITVDTSEGSTVSYQLYNASTNAAVQSPKTGTGSSLTWTGLPAGSYYVIATNTATNCTATSTAATTGTVANPTALVLTGSSICASSPGTGTITSSTSATGVSYQLYNSSNVAIQSPKTGTGSGLTWSSLAAGTGYYVIATGAAPTNCTSTSNTANVSTVANPTALVLTGSSICASAPGTGTITSSTSATGVSYQLFDNTNTAVQTPKTGTGSGLTWTGLAAGNGYYVVATGAAPTNCTSTSNTANVTSVANPVALVLTGSSICASAPGTGTITSSTSATGVSYQLFNSSNTAVQTPKTGTGSGLTWTGLSAGTGYYVVATGAAPTNCTSTSNTANVTSVANPVALVLTGSSICASAPGTGTITSSTSEAGVSYQLFDNTNTAVQTPKTGTGSGLTWTGLAAGNGYYVVATGAAPTNCTSTSNTANVTSVANPVALVLTGSSICASAPGTGTITSSTSATGVSYQLFDNTNTAVQTPKTGTGSSLTWTGLAAGNGYYVVATGAAPTNCTSTSNTANVTSVANPVALVLTGSTICVSPGGNGTITSSTSQTGVSYQLFDNTNTAVQTPKTGTGSGLTWSGLSAGTGYYVVATGAAPTNCTSTSNTANVSTVANPTALVLTGSSICASAPGTGTITSSTSATGVSYQLFDNTNTAVQTPKTGTGSGLTWTGLSAGTGYYVVATGAAPTNCTSTSNTANVTTVANPVALILTGSTICVSPGGNGTITSSTSATGVSYQLFDNTNTAVQAPKAGTGSGLTWSGLSAGTGYYVVATGAAPTNCTSTSNTANVSTVANPTALVLTGSSICASAPGTGTITSSTSATGVSYQLFNSANTAIQSPKAGTGSGLTWTGLAVGTGYYVVATGAAPTNCTSTSNTADVTSVANPVALVLTGSTICVSPGGNGTITSSTSQTGVSYQLFDNTNTAVQTPKTGTGSGLTWSGLAAGTGYYVVATGASPTNCTSTSNTANVSTVANPTALVLTGSSICASAPGTGTITSSTSATGVSYQLFDNTNTAVQAPKAGTGSGLTWTGLSAGTGYYVIATGAAPTNCTSTSNTANVTSVANPVALVLTGSTICVSPGGNGTITSSTSATGVSYQLFDNTNTAVQAPKTGTGSGLTWSGLSAGTGYYVVATGAAPTNCTSTSNTANVSTVANPTALVLTGSSICASAPGTGTISSSTSQTGVSYQLFDNTNTAVQTPKTGTGSGLTWTGLSAGTGYYVVATGAAPTNCTSTSNTASVTTVANPVALVLTGSSICASAPGTGTITSSTSATGVSYQLFDNTNTAVQTPKAGTGSGLTWTGLSAGTGYYVVATGAAPTNCTSTSNTTNVTSVANPVALVLTGSSICASAPGTGTISSSTSQTGVSYQLFNSSNTAVQTPKTGTGSGLTWTGLAAGNGYYVVATGSAPTNCTSTSNTANVTSVANPVALVLTGSSICASAPGTGTITSSTSEAGVSYQLFDNTNTAVQTPKTGTGSGLTWTGLSAGNGYYVVATGAAPTNCTSTSNTANVTSVANPVALVLTGSSICASAPGTGTISSSTSATGVSYQLFDNTNTAVQTPKTGTGSGLTWTGLAAGNGYYVVATGASPTNCTSTSNTANVTSVANPVALVLTGSSICASAPGTGTISSSTSQTGVSYQLFDNTNTAVQTPKTGTGSGLTWTGLAAGTGYYVVATGAAPTNCTSTSNTANVTSVANPVALVLTGSSICASAPGTGTISSSTSQTGVSYQLFDNTNTAVQTPKTGTGSGLTWTGLSAGTGYYVVATGAAPTNCTSTSNTANVTSVANPVALVLTGSSICASAPGTGTISSSTSQTGVSYQLFDNTNTAVQTPKTGTGSGLTWTGLAAGTGYYVVATGAAPTNCTSTSNTASVTTVANPVALVLTGSSICASAPGTGTITSSTSATGVSYQLFDNTNTAVQTPKTGTGSGLTWTGLAAGNGYYVVATGASPTNCTSTSNTANVTSVANPVALVLTGSSICASAPGTGTISSSTSQTGVSYQLFDNTNTAVQTPKTGTGSSLTWTGLSAGTGYYVVATGAAPTNCTSTSNTANVTSVANPVALVLTGSSICASAPGTGTISSSTSQTGVSYQLFNSSNTAVQTPKTGTGSGLTWTGLAAGTGYYVVATGAAPTNCTSTSNTANVTSVANPVALVLTGSSICASAPGTGTITSSTSESGVSYQLFDITNTAVQTPKTGTGSGLTWTGLSAGNGYYVVATGAAPTNCTSTSNTTNVTSVANPVALVLTGSSICASAPGTGTISSSTSQTGVSYQLFNSSNTAVQTPKTGTGSGLTWTGLAAGTGYYVVATGAAPTNCTSTSNTANVTSVPNPVALVLTGSSICASAPGTGTITSSTSATGVSYQLFDNTNTAVQAPKAGTGSGLTWTGLSAGTGYYVVATGAAPTNCTSTSNTVNVTSVANPVALVLTGSSICASAPGTGTISSSTSATGVSYQLFDNTNTAVQAPKAGTGSGLTWTGLSAGTGYYVVATGSAPTNCTSTSNTANVTSVANPVALVLTGSSICASAPGTGTISSSTSQTGVSYQLFDNTNTAVQTPKTGTGSGLTWTGLSAGTGYYVVATGAAPTNCTSTSNTANVTSVANPVALVLTGSSICASAPGTGTISSSTSQTGVSYQLFNSSNTAVQTPKTGTGSGLTWTGLSAGTGYYVVATGSAPTNCTSTSNTANVTSVANPVALVLTGSSICASAPGTGTISSSTSQTGVSYQLFNSSNTAVQTPKTGTGSGLTWTGLAAGNGYYVVATGAAPTNCTSTSNTANVTSVANPVALVLTGSSICAVPGGNGTVTSSTSQTGVSYQLYDNTNTAVQSPQAGTGSGLTWSGLNAANGYYVVATGAAPTNCTSTSNTANVSAVANPVALVLTGSSICASNPNTGTVTSSTSQSGVNYQLYNGLNTPVQSPQAGTGSGLTWSGLPAADGYHAIATGPAPTNCTTPSNSVNVNNVDTPVALVLTGSTICSVPGGNGTITSTTSENGISYQLYDNTNTPVQSAQTGTGSGLTWSGLNAGSGYYVVATSSFPITCATFSNLANVMTNTPVTTNAGADSAICANLTYTLAGSVTGGATTGTWTTSGDGSFNPGGTTLNAVYTPGTTDISNGTVTLILTSDQGGACPATVDSMVLTIKPLPNPNITLNPVCQNATVTLPTQTGLVWMPTVTPIPTANVDTIGIPYIYTDSVTHCSVTDTADLIVQNCGVVYGTYTQGYLGSTGSSCDGANVRTSAKKLLGYLLGTYGGFSVGRPGRSVVISNLDSAIIYNVMPGGSSPNKLTVASNVNLTTLSGTNIVVNPAFASAYLNSKSKINNVMLSQTITLTLATMLSNVENFPIQYNPAGNSWFQTEKVTNSCGNWQPISCTADSFKIQQNVAGYLTGNGAHGATVTDLLNLANDLLGGVKNPGSGVPSYADVTNTMDVILNAFDGWRFWPGQYGTNLNAPCYTVARGVASNNTAGTTLTLGAVKLYPNPNQGTFTVVMPDDFGKATITVTDVTGKVIIEKTNEMSNKVEINIGNGSQGLHFVNVSTGNTIYRFKISIF
jgi:hypothetical protein